MLVGAACAHRVSPEAGADTAAGARSPRATRALPVARPACPATPTTQNPTNHILIEFKKGHCRRRHCPLHLLTAKVCELQIQSVMHC